MAKPKYYWLLSDNKTVREISWEQYRKLHMSKTPHKLCRLHDTEIAFNKGHRFFLLPLRQLKQILDGEKVG